MSYQHVSMDETNVIFRMKIQGYGQAEKSPLSGSARRHDQPGAAPERQLRRSVLAGRGPGQGQCPAWGAHPPAEDGQRHADGLRDRAA